MIAYLIDGSNVLVNSVTDLTLCMRLICIATIRLSDFRVAASVPYALLRIVASLHS